MDWKWPVASVLFATATIFAGHWIEPMWELGDDRWLYASLACLGFIVAIYLPSLTKWWQRRSQQSTTTPAPALVDYVTACSIANRYIDPDESMKGGKRIAVRSQILAKFERVVGAKQGDLYEAALLHQWFQKNAARALVTHQDKIV